MNSKCEHVSLYLSFSTPRSHKSNKLYQNNTETLFSVKFGKRSAINGL